MTEGVARIRRVFRLTNGQSLDDEKEEKGEDKFHFEVETIEVGKMMMEEMGANNH